MTKKKPALQKYHQKQTKKSSINQIHQHIVLPKNQKLKKKLANFSQKNQQSSELNFFTAKFYENLNNLEAFYKDLLLAKHWNDNQKMKSQLCEMTKNIQQKIQQESQKIFKHQLQSTDQWIKEQIKKMDEQIKSVQSAYAASRESLMKTDAFSEEEVKKQLYPIQSKIDTKKQIREKYSNLLKSSKLICLGTHCQKQPF